MKVLLDIADAIRSQGVEHPFVHSETIPPQEIFGETVQFEEIRLRGTFCLEDRMLRLKGELTGAARGRCSACLAPVVYPLHVPFDESFRQTDRREALAAKEEDQEAFWEERLAFEGSRVELSHLALTLAVLDLPIRFRCEPECAAAKALRENNLSHACQKELPDQRPFSALQQLLTKDQEV